MASTPEPVLLVGDPRLRKVSVPVEDVRAPAFAAAAGRLAATLAAFRAARGFGRAISAPQIGVARRFIACYDARSRRRGAPGRLAAPRSRGASGRAGASLAGLALPGTPRMVVNPEVTWRSDATFTMWDDCMSFPSLLVRVRRFESISVRYVDERGDRHEWNRLPRAESELLQHEIDHLDGILALDLALDREAIVHREVFDADRARFRAMVDYVIG